MVAIAHFPDGGRAIKELAERDENSLSFFTDLTDVEAALRRWKISPLPVRDIRCAEYQELVPDLTTEIGVELDRRSLASGIVQPCSGQWIDIGACAPVKPSTSHIGFRCITREGN